MKLSFLTNHLPRNAAVAMADFGMDQIGRGEARANGGCGEGCNCDCA